MEVLLRRHVSVAMVAENVKRKVWNGAPCLLRGPAPFEAFQLWLASSRLGLAHWVGQDIHAPPRRLFELGAGMFVAVLNRWLEVPDSWLLHRAADSFLVAVVSSAVEGNLRDVVP